MKKNLAKGIVNCDGNLWKDKPLAHVKLSVLKLVFTLQSSNMLMLQGLQWFLRTRFSPLLIQEEEQQSSSVLQTHTSLDTGESFSNPWRICLMSQSVLALSWFNKPKLGKGADSRAWDMGWEQGQQNAPMAGGCSTHCCAPQGHCTFQSAAGRCGKVWIPAGEGSFLLTGKEGFIKTDLTAELQSQIPARAKKGKLMELTGSKALDDSDWNGPSDVLMHFRRKSS